MSFKKICIVLVFQFIVILSFSQGVAKIQTGVLDLRGVDLESHEAIALNGEWEFYWRKLISGSELDQKKHDFYINVPSFWNAYTQNDEELSAQGGGTYRLQILLDKTHPPLGVKIGNIGTAFKCFANEKEIASAGTVSLNEKDAKPGYTSGVYPIYTQTDTLNLVFQVSNFHYCKGGVWSNYMRIGSLDKVHKSWNKDVYISLLILGCFLIFAFYHLGLFFMNVNFRYTLFFGLFCLLMALRTSLTNEMLLLKLFPDFNWNLWAKLEYLTIVLGAVSFLLFIYHLFRENFNKKALKVLNVVGIVGALSILVLPPLYFTGYLLAYQIYALIGAVYIIAVVIKSLKTHRILAAMMLGGFILLLLSVVNDVLYANKVINTGYIIPYGFLLFIFSQGLMLAQRFSMLYIQTDSLAQKLEGMNKNLEKLVEQRTEKIQEQNYLLTEQKDEIQAQRDSLAQQHELVQKQKMQITSSIQYASRIQTAILEKAGELEEIIPESFLMFHPKDIVSGDFYWFRQLEIGGKKLSFIAVVDCTGHGVPGAFMSILGALFLKSIVENNEKLTAADVLNKMRVEVKELLGQGKKQRKVSDGMDMSLIIVDEKKEHIQFAGANNPLFIIRKQEQGYASEIEEFKGDRMPIGYYAKEKESFTNIDIEVNKGDLVYLFSDGYFDQFHGETREKFKKKRFKELLLQNASESMTRQELNLETALLKWQGSSEQIDDITVVGLKI